MDKIFIEQAKNIRREYIKNINAIAKCEGMIDEYKNKLVDIQSILKDGDEKTIKDNLMEIEKNIKIIEEILSPYTTKITSLEKDADKLFENIKERHPNMEMEEIQKELIPYLLEINY